MSDTNNTEKSPESQTEQKPQPTPQNGGKPEGWAEEIGGPKGPEPTRYGDWEVGGICSDF